MRMRYKRVPKKNESSLVSDMMGKAGATPSEGGCSNGDTDAPPCCGCERVNRKRWWCQQLSREMRSSGMGGRYISLNREDKNKGQRGRDADEE
jgi:hypothetical protein